MARSAQNILNNLVYQFSDQFAFIRELVQNSMDEGSQEIYVDIQREPVKAKGRLKIVLSVADTGNGMTREIIENELTRLFSSTKEGDETKIGKFGIGFVSVFSIQPNLVVVDTGCQGEFWRVKFYEDKTFDLIRLTYPVEGTTVTLEKEIAESEADEFESNVETTLRYWCKHAESDIYFNQELINEEFTLGQRFEVVSEFDDTTIVMAPTTEPEPFYGFYNKGLTLKEGQKQYFPGIMFKLKSKYLEHTLTRDTVLLDENYERAMKLLEDAFRSYIFKLKEQLESKPSVFLYESLMGYPQDLFKKEFGSLKFPLVGGGTKDLATLLNQEVVIYASEQDDWVDQISEKEGGVVLISEEIAAAFSKLLGRFGREGQEVGALQDRIVLVEKSEGDAEMKAFATDFSTFLGEITDDIKSVMFGTMALGNHSLKEQWFWFLKPSEFGQPISANRLALNVEKSFFSFWSKDDSEALVLNIGGSSWEHLLSLIKKDSSLALYFLSKLLFLRTESLTPEVEELLLKQAVDRVFQEEDES